MDFFSRRQNKLDILILGGTQFVGKHLVDAFSNTNHNITVFNRGNNNYHKDVEYLYGDRIHRNFDSLKDKKWDIVIDIPYFETDVVRDTLDFLYDKTNLYIFISTISVYDVGVHPDSEYDSYCTHKLNSERLFQNKESKTLILRPGVLCGEGDNTDRFIYDGDKGIFWKHSHAKVEDYIPIEDFAEFIVKMIDENRRGVYEYVAS